MFGLLRLLLVFFIVWGLLGWGWATNPYAAGFLAWVVNFVLYSLFTRVPPLTKGTHDH